MNERVRHILGVVLEMPEQDINEKLSAELRATGTPFDI